MNLYLFLIEWNNDSNNLIPEQFHNLLLLFRNPSLVLTSQIFKSFAYLGLNSALSI